MSVSIVFHGASDGDDGPFSLASASGWEAFGDWAETLPVEYSAVKQLAEEGDAVGTDALGKQLAEAVEKHPPKRAVQTTIQGLLEKIGVGDPDEIASVVE